MISTAKDRGVTTVTLDSPRTRNALSAGLVASLTDALAAAGGDRDTRAVVLAHTGNTVCAGADLRTPPPPDALTGLLRLLLTVPTPVVARVTGHVRAGGLGLLGACDMAVSGPDATFAFTEVRIGVAPAVISLPLLPRLDPRAASRYFLTGERFSPARAAAMGLLTATGDDVDAELEPVLAGLRASSPQGLAETKRLLNARVLEVFDREAQAMTDLSARLFATADAREGMTAFLERRDPTWSH